MIYIEDIYNQIGSLKNKVNNLKKIKNLAILIILTFTFAFISNMDWPKYDDSSNSSTLALNMGIAMAKKQEWQLSEIKCRESIKLNPRKPESYVMLGIVLAEQNKFEKAIKALEVCINISPFHAPAFYNLAIIYAKLSKSEGDHNHKMSVSYFEKANKLDPISYPYKPKN